MIRSMAAAAAAFALISFGVRAETAKPAAEAAKTESKEKKADKVEKKAEKTEKAAEKPAAEKK